MATDLETSISYLASDFDTIKDELIDKLRETESWVDLYEGGVGMTLIELFSFVGDMLSFYVNMMANETYLDTAKLRSSIISLCKMIRYKLSLPSSALTTLKFTVTPAHTEEIRIPRYTTVSRFDDDLGENVYYVTDEILSIPAGETEGTVTAYQGVRRKGTESNPGYTSIGTSDGLVNQDFVLPTTNIADGSVTLYVDGEQWEEVDFLIDYGPDDKVFKVDWKADDRLYVYFGDNRVGSIPEDNADIRIDYTETEEEYGNTGTNTITTLVDPIQEYISGSYVDDVTDMMSVTNITEATGGGARETKEHAKVQAPKISRAAERAVTIEDYEALIGAESYVAKVNCIDRKDTDEIPFRQVWIYGVTDGGGDVTTNHRDHINDLMQLKALAGTDWLIKETEFIYINVDITYYYSNPDYATTVRSEILDALNDYFAVDNLDRDYGEAVTRNDLIVEITNLDQVSFIELNQPTEDVELTYNQYPMLGTVTLTDGGLV